MDGCEQRQAVGIAPELRHVQKVKPAGGPLQPDSRQHVRPRIAFRSFRLWQGPSDSTAQPSGNEKKEASEEPVLTQERYKGPEP